MRANGEAVTSNKSVPLFVSSNLVQFPPVVGYNLTHNSLNDNSLTANTNLPYRK